MPKVSQLPQDSSPVAADFLVGDQASGPTTQRFKLSDLATFMWTLANIPTGQTSPITRDSEMQFPFVASGMVWSGDSVGVNRNASMTAGVCYINGRRISISAVTARTFTASKDTYIDVLDNGDGTGTLVYTEVTNNSASPALASNSIRIGIIITGATTIAAATSVNQGQETMVLPIASSIPYAVTDSLGNLICPRDPTRRLLGYRRLQGSFSTATVGAYVAVTAMSAPFIAPGNRKVRATFEGAYSNGTATYNAMAVLEGAATIAQQTNTSTAEIPFHATDVTTPSAGLHTYVANIAANGGTSNVQYGNGAYGGRWPAVLMIELE